MLKYNLTEDDGVRSSVTAFIDGGLFAATADHPNFNRICTSLLDGPDDEPDWEARIRDLFDVSVSVGNKFRIVTDRVSVMHGKVYFDGAPVDGAITKAILAYNAASDDDSLLAVANFMEKIALNPDRNSREQLFVWLGEHDFGICPDGDFIAYKGLQADGTSQYRGTAIVNGVVVNGHIPNAPGTVIEMPRHQVTNDPGNACAQGLHVANWRFAQGWDRTTVRVKVNPRDVVSVPRVHSEKMRVCRYRVVDRVTAPDKSIVAANAHEKTLRVLEQAGIAPVAPTPPAKPGKPKAGEPKPQAKKRPLRKRIVNPDDLPKYYEQFTLAHWRVCPRSEVDFVARDWNISGRGKMDRDSLNKALAKEARARIKTWPENER